MEDTTLNFGEEHEPKKMFRQPFVILFHLLFRVLALLSYLFCGVFLDSFIASFLVILLFLCLDFWTVKNVTGRLLVGLRWWNEINADGKSEWIFENKQRATNSTMESQVFWAAQVVSVFMWILFIFISLIKWNFTWIFVTIFGAGMTGSNLYGYVRCKLGSTSNIKSVASNFFGKQLLSKWLSSKNTESQNPVYDT